jgi:hypothetical protein
MIDQARQKPATGMIEFERGSARFPRTALEALSFDF